MKSSKIYNCKTCDYTTSRHSQYARHLLTAKHKILINPNKKSSTCERFFCDCGKAYNHASSLCAHKKKCNINPNKKGSAREEYLCDCGKAYDELSGLYEHNKTCEYNMELANKMRTVNNFGGSVQQTSQDPVAIIELIKQNQDFKTLLIEQQKENQSLQRQLIEAVKDSKVVNNTTNNNNQKFNLNFFLNNTCKDAMNMSEFIDTMEINFKDIENIGKQGYISGMTEMIVSRMRDLDITKRPLHCTDLKRETMYIKDNNEWSKDSSDNTKLRNMITIVAKQNCNVVPLWRKEHPECSNYEHPNYNLGFDIMRNTIGSVGTEQNRLDSKVIKNISKHIIVK